MDRIEAFSAGWFTPLPVQLPAAWSNWHVIGALARGSFGQVFLAEDELGKKSVIKVIPYLVEDSVAETDIWLKLKDAKGIVQLEDVFVEERSGKKTVFVRMEFLTDFRIWLLHHSLDEKILIGMMLDLSEALRSLEEHHILHRDIKPGNILVDNMGHAKLCDFGVSRLYSQEEASLSIQGTFDYMSPEIYHGKNYDHRADQYSLGMVFYQLVQKGESAFCLTGKHPEQKDSDMIVEEKESFLNRRMKGISLPPPENVSPELAGILLKTCAFLPKDRYRTADALIEDLKRLTTVDGSASS